MTAVSQKQLEYTSNINNTRGTGRNKSNNNTMTMPQHHHPSVSHVVPELDRLRQEEESHHYRLHPDTSADMSEDFSEWRLDLLDTFQRTAAKFGVRPSTIEATMWIMDRLAMQLDTSLLASTQSRYEITGMVAFYTAIKVHDTDKLTPKLSDELLSFGGVTESKMEELEVRLLLALEWQFNPPTPTVFSRILLDTLSSALLFNTSDSEDESLCQNKPILDMIDAQLRLALRDSSCILCLPSDIALAALLNAIQCFLPSSPMEYIQDLLCNALDPDEYQTTTTRRRAVDLPELQERLYHGLILAASEQAEEEDYEEEEDEEEDTVVLDIPAEIYIDRPPMDRGLSMISFISIDSAIAAMS
jgi:hypothetical protein